MQSSYLFNLFKKCKTSILSKLCVALLILICVDFVTGKVINHFYFIQTSGPEFVTSYAIDKTKADILIFGSSRANHHYHPRVFEDKLHLTCFNAGRDGFDIFYHYAVLKTILTRYKPKIAILDLKTEEFKKMQSSYDQLSVLLPYYKNHPEIREIVQLKSRWERLRTFSQICPFNSTLSYIILGNTDFNRKRRNEINGYVPLTKQWKGPVNTYRVDNDYELDPKKIKIYENFIRDCLNSKIKLYIITSPYYVKYLNIDKSIELGHNIAEKYNIPYYDFSNDTTFINHPDLFSEKDKAHLNNAGAEILTTEIIEKYLKPTKQD